MRATSGRSVTYVANSARFNLQGVLPIVNTLLPVQNVFVEDGRTRGQVVEFVHFATSNVRSRVPSLHSCVGIPQGQGPEDAGYYGGSQASYMEDVVDVPHDQAWINCWLESQVDGMNNSMTSILAGIQSIQ